MNIQHEFRFGPTFKIYLYILTLQDDSSDSDIQEIDSDIEELPAIAFHIETAQVIAKDPGWNPKVVLRDPYNFPETSLPLPPKPAVRKTSKRTAEISEDIQIVDAEPNDIQSDDEIIEIDTEDNSETKKSKLILYWYLKTMETRDGPTYNLNLLKPKMSRTQNLFLRL